MSNTDYTYFTTPVGRLVSGSITQPKTKDNQGNPFIIKRGVDIGKSTQKFDFGLAVPKGREASWKETTWGKQLHDAAIKAWPNGQHAYPVFSSKVIDGDSTQLNAKQKRPCESEGYPGHWIIYFSSNKAPQTVNNTGHAAVDPKSIKKGDWVQIAGSTIGNENAEQPGMYMNHGVVSFQWAGDPIATGPDTSQMGFGGTPAPAGASVAPTGSFTAPAPTAPVAAVPAPVAPTAPVAPLVVVPHTAILTPPPPAPAAPAGAVMTVKAGGAKYADFINNGWTHAQLIENGYIAA